MNETVLLMVLARLKAEGKDLSNITKFELDKMVEEAVADLTIGVILPRKRDES